nr:MAG TPA: hypothetical protein [Caudoviricetes sp.]
MNIVFPFSSFALLFNPSVTSSSNTATVVHLSLGCIGG